VIAPNVPAEIGLNTGNNMPVKKLKYVPSTLVLIPLKKEPMFRKYTGSKLGILFLYAQNIITSGDKR
jgi:hypothetical protein